MCPTTKEKAQKNLSQGSWRMPVGTMKTEYTEQKQNIMNMSNSIKMIYKFNTEAVNAPLF
jgi:hypothetical protein